VIDRVGVSGLLCLLLLAAPAALAGDPVELIPEPMPEKVTQREVEALRDDARMEYNSNEARRFREELRISRNGSRRELEAYRVREDRHDRTRALLDRLESPKLERSSEPAARSYRLERDMRRAYDRIERDRRLQRIERQKLRRNPNSPESWRRR